MTLHRATLLEVPESKPELDLYERKMFTRLKSVTMRIQWYV